MSIGGPKACALAVSLVLVVSGRIDRAWGNGDDPFANFKVASTETLSEMRGGFVGTVGGRTLDLAFGIEQAVLINDQLVVATRLTVPNINRPAETRLERFVAADVPTVAASTASTVPVQSGAPTTQIVTIQNTGSPIGPVQVTTSVVNQLKVSTIQSQAGQLNLVQVGAGNTLSLNLTELPQGTLNVIQNTLDNQTIRQSTTIQITANTASLVRMMNFGAILQRQIAGSLK